MDRGVAVQSHGLLLKRLVLLAHTGMRAEGLHVSQAVVVDEDHIVGGIWQREDELVDGWRALCVDLSSRFVYLGC